MSYSYPLSAFLVILDLYPFSILSSSTVYSISFPPAFLGKFLNVCVHSFLLFNSIVCINLLFPFNVIVTSVGLFPSWLLASSQILFTFTLVISGLCVFVIKYPFLAFPVISVAYPSTESSFIVYLMFLPLAFLSSSSNVPAHWFEASNILVATSVPFASNLTIIDDGLIPSWLPPSFQSLLTLTLVFSTSCVFVILYPFATSPETTES